MPPLRNRVEKQRALVRRLRAQLAFEALVLARLDARSRPDRNEPRPSMGAVLANARERQTQAE